MQFVHRARASQALSPRPGAEPPVTRHAPRRIPPAPASRGSCGPHSSSASRGSKFVTPRRRLWMPRHTDRPHIGRYAMGKGIEPSLPSLVSRTAQRTLESTIFRFDRSASFWDFLARQRSPSAQCSERQHATVVSSTAVSAPSARVIARAFVCSIAFRVRKRPEPCRMVLRSRTVRASVYACLVWYVRCSQSVCALHPVGGTRVFV